MTGGELVARSLTEARVGAVFTLVAGHTTPIIDACIDSGVRLVDVRHEEAATHMATGWARRTGNPGVALVTAGPGVTNAATGVANAWSAGVPIFVLAGRAPLAQADKAPLHEMDQIGFMKPITKWAATVLETGRLPEYVGRAIAESQAGRPGPVFLEVPSELLRADAAEPAEWHSPPARARSAAAPSDVEAAAALLRAAESPLILAGSGVFWAQAWDELRQLVEKLAAPVITSHAARGVIPFDHPNHVPAARSLALSRADVVLVVGSRFNFMLAYGQPPRWNPDGKVIQVDIEAEAIGRNRPVELGLLGDAQVVLAQLAGALPERSDDGWLAELRGADRDARSRLADAAVTDAEPIHPLQLCHELASVLEPDAFVAVDGGDILSFARQAVPATGPGGWIDSGAFGCLGYGIPAAAAAKLATPDRQSIALVGDGAFGLTAVELDTAARHGLGILVVISNNGAWAIETTSQEMEFGRSIGTELKVRPYHLLAESLGCEGIEVAKAEELGNALRRPVRDRPLVVNVLTDPQAKSPDAVRGLGLVPREQAIAFEKR